METFALPVRRLGKTSGLLWMALTVLIVSALIIGLIIAPLVLVVASLLVVLRVAIALAALIVVVILITLLAISSASSPTILWEVLPGLERLCAGLERICSWAEPPSLVVVQIHLLGLPREIVILGGRIVFPRVEIRHCASEETCWP